MTKLRNICGHLTVVLSLMFAVFLVLDQFNPMMNFVDNSISRYLLAVLCLSGILQTILSWRQPQTKAESARTNTEYSTPA